MNVIEKVKTISLTMFDMMQNLFGSTCIRAKTYNSCICTVLPINHI